MAMRTRRAALLMKLQSVAEVYEAPSAGTDGMLVEAPSVNTNPQNTSTNEVTGSLDSLADIAGGFQVSLSFPVYMKGNASPGQPPQWAKALKVCGWEEVATLQTISGTTFSVTGTNTINDSGSGLAALTVGTPIWLDSPKNPSVELLVATSAAGALAVTKPDGSAPGLVNESSGVTFTIRYGVPAVVATAGSVIAATAQSPWSNTLQAYRGMPAIVSGNPATPFYTSIIDYLASRVATLADKFGSTLDTSTKIGIPANVLYRPTSDLATIKMASLAFYQDGVLWKFSDARGTVSFEMTAAKAWRASFNLSALYVGREDQPVPAVTYDGTRPGVWRQSKMLIDRVRAALRNFSFNNGAQTTFPDDPNANEGFTSPEIMSRKMTFTADPQATPVATRDLMTAFRTGVQQPIHASLIGGAGARPGNRIILNLPAAQYDGNDPGDRDGIAIEQLRGMATGQDAGAFLAIY